MNQVGEYIEDRNSFFKWIEWGGQSMHLCINWLSEVWRDGFMESTTATAFATTPFGVRDICNALPLDSLEDGDKVYEIGGALGPMVQEILRRVRKDIEYHLVDVNENFLNQLGRKVSDTRLHTHHLSGVRIGELAEAYGKGKIVLSSMPFSHDHDLSREIITAVRDDGLEESGVFAMWNFRRMSIQLVLELFGEENCNIGKSPLNLPPLKTILARSNQSLLTSKKAA